MVIENLKHKSVHLRAVEPSDATTLFMWENDTKNWKISHTEVPFSMHNIHQLIEQFSNVRNSGQLRLMIAKNNGNIPIGAIDLFDLNFKHGFATLGIIIALDEEKGKGYATEAMELAIKYCNEHLELYNLQCFVHEDNLASVNLFTKLGFREVGIRKNWYRYQGKRINEIAYQLCLKEEI